MGRTRLPAILLLLMGLLASCGGGGGGDDDTLRITLTDAPAQGVQAVRVTITSVRIHQSADAESGMSGWFDVPVTAAMPVNLLQLRGGVLYELCRAAIGAGHYQQVRLVLAPNGSGPEPYRNSVTTIDGVVHPLEVPSEAKIVHSFWIAEGTLSDLTLDFDAEKSLGQRGNGQYFLNPVISASSTVP